MNEADVADKCDHNYIRNELLSEGFKVVENNNNFHYVLIK